MSGSKKNRRSDRIPATYKLILTILGASGSEVLKEIITTLEVSRHGARIQGRRTLQKDWKGAFVQLSSGRQAPVRIVWQAKSDAASEFMESGVEILADYDFWGKAFSEGDLQAEQAAIVIENSSITPEELLQAFAKHSAFQAEQSGRLLESLWCGLVQQLEERGVIGRQDLVKSIRKVHEQLAQPSRETKSG
jgi:hypothetical protein